jgi:predicted metal-dependent hydrolase
MTAVLRKTSHPVAPRKTSFDLEVTPRHWLDGDPQSTHTFNVGNLLFPTGERFFNDSVRNALPYITDETLRAEIRGFLGQEVTHGNEHERCVERMCEHGINFTREMAAFVAVRRWLNCRVESLADPARRQAVLCMLAVTAGAEHLTASLAGYILAENSWSQIEVDPGMQQLLLWHASEEIEHRHVAFDAYQQLGGGYVRRAAAILPIGLLVVIGWPLLTSEIMRRDRSARGFWSWRRHVQSARRGVVFSLPRVAWDIRLYLKPGHHPSDLPGSLDLALRYLDEAPSVLGLRGRARRRDDASS